MFYILHMKSVAYKYLPEVLKLKHSFSDPVECIVDFSIPSYTS